MIDHLAIDVSDLEKSGRFYDQALKPLGYRRVTEEPRELGGRRYLGWADASETDLYVNEAVSTQPRLHLAFRAATREAVDAFYARAIAAGGEDNGAPGPRPHYHEHYYGAFVLDPDGHNVEAVCHDPPPAP